jgi:hypothetical protein
MRVSTTVPVCLGRERQAVDQDVDVAVDAVLGGILDPHLIPARLHLLGDQHGERRLHALAHLGARHGDDHRVVARDLDPAAEPGLVRLDVEQRASPSRSRSCANHQPTPTKPRPATPPTIALRRVHFTDAPASSAAARCTARRSAP